MSIKYTIVKNNQTSIENYIMSRKYLVKFPNINAINFTIVKHNYKILLCKYSLFYIVTFKIPTILNCTPDSTLKFEY